MREPLIETGLSAADLAILKQVSLFSALPSNEVEQTFRRFEVRSYPRGAAVFHQEDQPRDLLIVRSGRIRIQLLGPHDRRLTLEYLTPGGYFGPLGLIDDKPRGVEAIAVEKSELFVLRNADFRAFLLQHPHTAMVLLDRFVGLMRTGMQRLYNHVLLDGQSRLARTLIEFGRQSGSDELVISLTQSELAGLTASSIESVNRWLRDFTRDGLISVQRGEIHIRDLEKLALKAE